MKPGYRPKESVKLGGFCGQKPQKGKPVKIMSQKKGSQEEWIKGMLQDLHNGK